MLHHRPNLRRHLALARLPIQLWGLAGICSASLLLGWWTLGHTATDYDEGVYWQALRAMAAGHALYGSIFMSQPPVFLLSVYPVYAPLGQSLVAARAAILLDGLIGNVAMDAIGRATGGPRVGLGAAVLFASDPHYATASVTLRSDLPALALARGALP